MQKATSQTTTNLWNYSIYLVHVDLRLPHTQVALLSWQRSTTSQCSRPMMPLVWYIICLIRQEMSSRLPHVIKERVQLLLIPAVQVGLEH